VTLKHSFDRLGMAFHDPLASGMLVHDEDVSIGVATAEQDNGVVMETVVESGKPLECTGIGEVIDDVGFAAEVGEELAGSDVPVTVARVAASR